MSFKSGQPDIKFLYKGRWIHIELKRPDGKGKPTKQQEKVIEQIKQHGGEAYLIDSLDELKSIIKGDYHEKREI